MRGKETRKAALGPVGRKLWRNTNLLNIHSLKLAQIESPGVGVCDVRIAFPRHRFDFFSDFKAQQTT